MNATEIQPTGCSLVTLCYAVVLFQLFYNTSLIFIIISMIFLLKVLVVESDDNETIPASPQSIISSDSDDVCVDSTEPAVDHYGKTDKSQASGKTDAESDSDSEV